MNPLPIELTSGMASVRLRREPWDCTQLRIEAAKVEELTAPDAASGLKVVQLALEHARQQRFQHLAARVPSLDRTSVLILQRAGFELVDTVLHFALAMVEPPIAQVSESPLTIRWGTSNDIRALGDLASAAFSDPTSSYNRYLNDPGFTSEQVRRVYSTWASTSVGGPAADSTLTAWAGSRLAGFITLKHPDANGVARVPLNAVSPDFRGQGLYRHLVIRAAQAMHKRGATRLEVTTQLQQLAVQRTWWGLGAQAFGSSYSFHRWLEPP